MRIYKPDPRGMAGKGWDKRMRKPVFIFFITFLFIASCHSFHHHSVQAQDAPLKVLASTFPVYIFAKNICAGAKNVNLELLIPASIGCPHDFTLRPADMRKLAQADILIINGDGLEDFLLKSLDGLTKKLMLVNAATKVPKLPLAGHGGHEDHEYEQHEHGGINPHIFASPSNAAIMVNNIADGLAKADHSNSETYRRNGESYSMVLENLGKSFEKIGRNAKNPNIALEHSALAYLARNARLQIVALFENGDSASTISRLIENLKKEKPVLLAGDSQYPDRLLKTLAQETGLPYVLLDTGASGPPNPPLDYYQQIMGKNLEILEARFD